MPRWPKRTLQERFTEKTIMVENTGCIEWTGMKDVFGYGKIKVKQRNISAHRIAYEFKHGKIERGLELDHLCRNRGCVNPDHLEPVTHHENVKRGLVGSWNRIKTHCKNGHELSGENLYYNTKSKRRACRLCHREWTKKWRKENDVAN